MRRITSKISMVFRRPHCVERVWRNYWGPIVIPHLYDGRNRTFFFAGYDGSRLRLGTTLSGIAPTPADIATATSLVQSQGITPNQLGLNILQLYSNLGLSGPFAVDNRGLQNPNSGVLKIDHQIATIRSRRATFTEMGRTHPPAAAPGRAAAGKLVHGLA